MIKTMSKEESKFMRTLLPHYFDFLRKYPHTFINPFFGMHRVQMSSFGHQVYFMVLGSVFGEFAPNIRVRSRLSQEHTRVPTFTKFC